ncbi:MAG: SusD/RagB family nutrient-binding outer membrane lipoprotein [Chitinophagaceae bacterium]
MHYRKILPGIVGILLLAAVSSSCKKQFDKLLANPNYPSPSTADVDLYLNEVQLDFSYLWVSAGDQAGQLSRMQHWVGPFYRNGYTPASFDGQWTNAYTGVLTNANALVPLAQSQRKYLQSGIARILKAFTLSILVDNFGDVPYSEAVLGNENTVPKVDPGATVYAAAQSLIDSALADFTKPNAAAFNGTDLFYGGSKANWTTFAKTLKLKLYMQVRLVDNSALPKIQALITENNLVNTPAQDFTFRYGTSVTAPDSRHTHYATDYTNSGNGDYLSNYYMWLITTQKYGGLTRPDNGDPRTRYYFYRQVSGYSWSTSSTCPCCAKSQLGTSQFPSWYPTVPDQTPYCTVTRGYHGRDHGDNSGAPPDGNYTTAWGVYPAGGEFDGNQFAPVALGMGGQGAGILPIWLSSFTSFLEAEASLALGITTAGTTRTLLEKGVRASITKVMAFPATVNVTPDPTYVPTPTQVENYVALVLGNYDAAATADAKLNIVMTEYYIAAWGNGLETYNNLRRTGKPANIQPAVAVPNPGLFMRSFFYPSVFVNRNSNAPAQKDPGNAVQKVFWDNNPDNFIK